MSNGKIVGFVRGTSQSGNPYAIAYVTYTDEKSKVNGQKVAEVFVNDEILKAVDDRRIVGSKCELAGAYNKKGEYKIYLNSITA